MAQSPSREELSNYVRRIAEHINIIYKRLDIIESRINSISESIVEIRALAGAKKIDLDSIKESVVSKSDFDEFVRKLTESFKEILPTVPESVH